MSNLVEPDVTRSDERPFSEMTVSRGLNFFAPTDDLLGHQVSELHRTKHLPGEIVDRYIAEAVKAANVKKLESGEFFAEIPGFVGVWAADEDLGACGIQLREVLLEWIVLKVEQNDRDLPTVSGISLNVL